MTCNETKGDQWTNTHNDNTQAMWQFAFVWWEGEWECVAVLVDEWVFIGFPFNKWKRKNFEHQTDFILKNPLHSHCTVWDLLTTLFSAAETTVLSNTCSRPFPPFYPWETYLKCRVLFDVFLEWCIYISSCCYNKLTQIYWLRHNHKFII